MPIGLYSFLSTRSRAKAGGVEASTTTHREILLVFSSGSNSRTRLRNARGLSILNSIRIRSLTVTKGDFREMAGGTWENMRAETGVWEHRWCSIGAVECCGRG